MRAPDHILVTGKPQSGKTTLVRRLLSRTPRWVALDPERDYADLPGVVECRAWAEGHGEPGPYARDLVADLADPEKELRLSLTADRPADHLTLARAVWTVHDQADTRTTALVMEEAWKLAAGQQLPKELKRVMFSGSKRGVWAVTVTQNPQQVPKQIRQASGVRVYLRLVAGLPKDMERRLRDDDLEKLPELEVLERHGGQEAERGRHYVTDPPELDLESCWREHVEGRPG